MSSSILFNSELRSMRKSTNFGKSHGNIPLWGNDTHIVTFGFDAQRWLALLQE
jgi:hypothetical protein